MFLSHKNLLLSSFILFRFYLYINKILYTKAKRVFNSVPRGYSIKPTRIK
nr:MAG TPA: hypothetical protein [Caudoviricetes sp.]